MYDNLEYAQMRLIDTVIRLKDGTPILVSNLKRSNGRIRVDYTTLLGVVGKEWLEELNLLPVPLGFVNYKGGCTYAQRMPIRNDYRQGLRNQNSYSKQGWKVLDNLNSLYNTIKGVYPKVDECFEDIQNKGAKRQAFSRSFAVGIGGGLLYKDFGTVGRFKDNITLHDKYDWLQEALEREVA